MNANIQRLLKLSALLTLAMSDIALAQNENCRFEMRGANSSATNLSQQGDLRTCLFWSKTDLLVNLAGNEPEGVMEYRDDAGNRTVCRLVLFEDAQLTELHRQLTQRFSSAEWLSGSWRTRARDESDVNQIVLHACDEAQTQGERP